MCLKGKKNTRVYPQPRLLPYKAHSGSVLMSGTAEGATKMKFLVVLMLAASFGWSSSVRAQWINTVAEDAFNGDQQIAMIPDVAAGYFFGFRCSNADDLAMIFGTPETSSGHEGSVASMTKMMVIIDGEPARSFDVSIDTWGENKFRFNADSVEVSNVILAVGKAKRRVAVAIDLLGKKYHSRVFKLNGSGRAVDKLVKSCEIEAYDDTEPVEESADEQAGGVSAKKQ